MARTDVWQGVVAGIARFAREVDRHEGITQFLDKGFTENMLDYVWRFVEPKQSESVPEEERWHPRGQRLFAEMLTIREMARVLTGEEPLPDEQIEGFAGAAVIWWNSFFHWRL